MHLRTTFAAHVQRWHALAAPDVSTPFSRALTTLLVVGVALVNAVAVVQALNLYHALALKAHVTQQLALRHGRQLFALEQRLHIAFEPAVQRLLARSLWTPLGSLPATTIRSFLVWIYLHAFPAWLFAALAWCYVYRPLSFVRLRDLTIVCALLAVACYCLMPVAPPRFVLARAPYGMHDWTYGGTSVDPHLIQAVGFNPYAAFPSMHLLAALIPALCLAWGSRALWVWACALCFPLVMALTIIGTGNHYVLDCIGSLFVLAAGTAIVRALDGLRHRVRRLRSTWLADPYELPAALCLCLCCAGFLALVSKPGGPRMLIAVEIVLLVLVATGRSPYLWQGRRRVGPGRQPLWSSDYVAGLLFVAGSCAATQPVAHLPTVPIRICMVLWLLACISALVRHLRASHISAVGQERRGMQRYLPVFYRHEVPQEERKAA